MHPDHDPTGRRSLLLAGFSSAAGLGMIAAGWALGRWPDAIIASVDRVFHAMGGTDALGAAARERHTASHDTLGGRQP
jgi:hypothetical protein